MPQGDDGNDHLCLRLVAGDVTNEGLIDLEPVDGKQFHVAEGRVTGAEVVDGEGDPHLAQLVQCLDGAFRIAHDDAFGQFQLQARWGHAGFVENVGYPLRQVLGVELARGEIDCHAQWFVTRLDPDAMLGARGAQHPLPDGHYQAGLFRHGDEFRRQDQPLFGLVPADQRLDPFQGSSSLVERKLGLVVKLELVPLEGPA